MRNNGRALGLDYGHKRIGIALSDPTLTIASPLTTLESHNVFSKLLEIIDKYEVKVIVIGKPISMSGESNNSQLQKVEKFIGKLKTLIDIEVILWDERLSTHASQRCVNEAKISRNKQKNIIDKVAASFILQGWIDYIRKT
ncbi:MAG: Holliday junction resolvase RuvX [Holosporales bacterium]|nr:Holliday junction resolvase RuvX [Holosporales bacterium]